MKVTLRHTYTLLFFLGIFFIPFNSYEGIFFLGEYKRDGAIVFFLFSFFLFFIDVFFKNKISLPFKSVFFQVLLLFVIILLISIVINIKTVSLNYMKGTSGFNRFIRQSISLLLALILFIVSYNILKKTTIEKAFFLIRRTFLYSLVTVTIYAMLEILIVVFDISFFKGVFSLFDYFPFTETSLDFVFRRISSVAYEPPFLAIYLITIAGWMFSYIFTSKGLKKYLPAFTIFLLTFFSGSRTALVVIAFQFLIFIGISFSLNQRIRNIVRKFLILTTSLLIILFLFNGKKVTESIQTKVASLNFIENLKSNISNKSRFGIQYTSLLVFIENPVFGVGFGQQGYHARGKYPIWATSNNYEFELFYLNNNEKSFPPGFNLYTRLLAETGIIGFLMFLLLIVTVYYQCLKMIKRSRNLKKIIPIVLLISFIGFSINWLQFDSFRIFGFWICLALLILLIEQKPIENE